MAAADGGPDVSVGPDTGDGNGGPDSGDASDSGTIIIPPGCDPTADPKDAAACVDDTFAVFVDGTNGSDSTGTGMKAAPFKMITTAITKLGKKSRIYVCEGTYAEKLTVTTPITIAGGFKCSDWSYSGTKSKIAPSSKGYGLQVTGANGVVVSDFDMKVLDATVDGESSIVTFVANSTVTFTRIDATAGNGKKGTDQSQVARVDPAAKGTDGSGLNGGPGAKNQCPGGDSVGGNGGTVATQGPSGGTPLLGGGQPGQSATAADCDTPSLGKAGAAGTSGPSAPKITALGELDATGWKPMAGGNGEPGTVGQGGGGSSATQGGGGGGGAGGCGGAGGVGGIGGGASIALLAFQSTVDLRSVSLAAKLAGNGGAGAQGQVGQSFGGGGAGGKGGSVDGCVGARGGVGGDGGAGAGGAGGIASAIVYKGKPPVADSASTLTPGTAGAAGAGTASNAGLPGKNEKMTEIVEP